MFDKYYFNSIFENFYFPDGSIPDWESIKKLQEFFMDWFNKERTKALLSFPIISAAMLTKNGKPKDEEFARMCSKEMSKGNSFFIYQSESADSLSSCCRLRNELQDNTFSYTLGASGVSTGCYDEETEVLTSNGWKYFKDVTLEDEMFTITKDGIIEEHKPKKIFKYPWDGYLKRIKNINVDLLVTPNHNMAVIDHHTNKIKLQTVEEIEKQETPQRVYLPTIGKNIKTSDEYFILPSIESTWITGQYNSKRVKVWEEVKIPIKDWAFFMGLYLSEGCICKNSKDYDIRLTQKKEKNKQYFRDCLNCLPFHWKEYVRNDGCSDFVIKNKQLFVYLEQFGNCYEKYIPKDLLNQGIDILQVLYEGLMLGDGHKRKQGRQECYYTSSKMMTDSFSELCLKIGRYPGISTRLPRETYIKERKTVSSTQYIINVGYTSMISIMKNKDINNEYYKGDVYCVEVPNHTLYVRRNNKYIWCGNSVNVITLNLNRLVQDKRDLLTEIKKIQKYQVAYRKIMEKYLKANLLTVYDAGFISLDKQYLTIGLNGISEAAEYLGYKPDNNSEYKQFLINTLKVIYGANKEARKEYGYMFNTEFVPGEGLGVKFASWDKKDGYVVPRDCYNSYFFPMEDDNINILDKLILHGKDVVRYLDGGSACHLNLEEHLTEEGFYKLICAASVAGCNYFTYNVKSTACNNCGFIDKRTLDRCSKCNSDDIDYCTRIIGYLKRVSSFSEERQKEEGRRYYHKKDIIKQNKFECTDGVSKVV